MGPYAVCTESGSAYEVREGWVTRWGPEVKIPGIAEDWPVGERRRLLSVEPVVESERWRFSYRDAGSGRAVAVSTSRVMFTAPVVKSRVLA
jgi:hypothetical protein